MGDFVSGIFAGVFGCWLFGSLHLHIKDRGRKLSFSESVELLEHGENNELNTKGL